MRIRDTYSTDDLHVIEKEIRQELKIVLSLAGLGPSMYSHLGHALIVAKATRRFLVTLVTSCMQGI